ncbi:Hypothetical protein SRAE_1000014700 [Strongyloides ratti]|uniref:Uncharacterized protein n=1 Tax=Strongyloides ratti TaxID=34506 RepID=A0A090KWS3_STRRB|nr:Hypothetical protein SRAE_1000014700 [Strongyloides ratti]CEF61871.1 Hypothetical protein SRAE_1000014700 [Strongyloides ratti]
MANTKEQDLYVIKTTFNIEMYKLPQKCNRNILSLLQSTTTKRFNRGFDKLKSFELKSCKNRKKNPFLKEKHNKIKEKIHLEDRRIQMMKKRNRILDKNHLISNGKSYHISLGTQEIRNITIYESTPKAMYLPLIYDENSRNGISKTVKNEKDIIMCNKMDLKLYFKMDCSRSGKDTKFVEINFTVEIDGSSFRHPTLHSLKQPQNTLFLERKFERTMFLEKKIGEIENKNKGMEDRVYEMRVRARNLEKRVKILEKRNKMLEKRTLKLKENRRIGSGKKVKITIERGEPINIAFCGSPSSDYDFSVSPYTFKNERLLRSESVDICQPVFRDDSMIDNQLYKNVMVFKNQSFGVGNIVEGISGLTIPSKQEEELITNDK